MATGKRALIVDDSRSARVILSRMLEQQGMIVDTAESAEQALEYLGHHRPDVIFMDHMMPGMDGFEAVQTIKANPQTGMIPLMMYTSQEGELYVSQARALGAVGVLPKSVRPADVSRVLYQLNLLPDRRLHRSALFDAGRGAADGEEAQPGAAATVPETFEAVMGSPISMTELSGSLRHALNQSLKDQLAEQRRFMLGSLEGVARRMHEDLKAEVAKIPVPEPYVPPQLPRTPIWPIVLTGLLASVPSLVLGGLFWQSQQQIRELVATVDRQRTAVEGFANRLDDALKSVRLAAPAEPIAATAAAGDAVAGGARPETLAVEYVDYGETPMAGARLERLRVVLAALSQQGFKGTLRIEQHVGDYCLSSNSGEGYALADPALPASRCELFGNPADDALGNAQRQSVAFANLVASAAQRSGGALDIEVTNLGRDAGASYPAQGASTTAGQWNEAAARHHRVEFRAVPSQ
jgi:CheY-like chemotaxis protein